MEDKLIKRIQEAAKYLEEKEIADVLGIPEEVVRDVLKGQLSDEFLKEYTYSNPIKIKVVEKPKFIKSRIVGILSPFAYEAAQILIQLVKEYSSSFKQKTMLIDASEYGFINNFIKNKPQNYFKHTAGMYKMSPLEDILYFYNDDIGIIFGYPNPERYFDKKHGFDYGIIKDVAQYAETVWVNLPLSPNKWSEILPECDRIIVVIKDVPLYSETAGKIALCLNPYINRSIFWFIGDVSINQLKKIEALQGFNLLISETADKGFKDVFNFIGVNMEKRNETRFNFRNLTRFNFRNLFKK